MSSSARAAAVKTPAWIDLERFERGESTEAEYLEQHVELAMAHVDPCLSEDRRAMFREALYEMLETDPVPIEMRRRAFGKRRLRQNMPNS